MGTQVVWFKRDLRVHDHEALVQAAAQGPVLCLYIVEPSYWQGRDVSQRQFDFLRECLRDLFRQLRPLGLRLHVVTGEARQILSRLHLDCPFTHLHSHQETGNLVTYRRDIAVAEWCRDHQVHWQEHRQHGVVRRLANRDHWHAHWSTFMESPQAVLRSVKAAQWPWPDESWPDWSGWGLPPDVPSQRQTGGRKAGLSLLHSFLTERSAQYRGGISSPRRAVDACSRLSPYLSWGCLSLREVVQSTTLALQQPTLSTWTRQGLQAFLSRLHWHDHFIQKLESEPAIEDHNMHRGYDGLRENDWNHEHFERLRTGTTGWPLVDACVRMLQETGWLNFRMRAMLVSVAAYPLWLHWKVVGDWLATQFVDYEPGIHWSQMQMQSGTTGINTTRVYNPIKQAQDQDPDGLFVRQWLPVLRRVPDAWLLEPWKMPLAIQQQCGVMVGSDWPMPIVDLPTATRTAKALLHARRQDSEVRSATQAIVIQHASRRGFKRPARARTKPDLGLQQGFDF